MMKRYAKLTILDTTSGFNIVHHNLPCRMVDYMIMEVTIGSKNEVYKIFRDDERCDEDIYLAYPIQDIEKIECFPEYRKEGIANIEDYEKIRYIIDASYLKKIAQDKYRYTIQTSLAEEEEEEEE